MKISRMLLVVFLMAAFSSIAMCDDTVFGWDKVPGQTWEKVRIYQRSGAAAPYTYTLKAEVDGSQTTATVTNTVPGMIFIARSTMGFMESNDSNAVGIKPDAPGTFRVITTTTTTVVVSPSNP